MLRFIWRKESTFINAGQSGADGGVVQLIMTLAAQPLLESLRRGGGVGPYFMDAVLFCSQMRCGRMPRSKNHNKASQNSVPLFFYEENGGGGQAKRGRGGRGHLRQSQSSSAGVTLHALETARCQGALLLNYSDILGGEEPEEMK